MKMAANYFRLLCCILLLSAGILSCKKEKANKTADLSGKIKVIKAQINSSVQSDEFNFYFKYDSISGNLLNVNCPEIGFLFSIEQLSNSKYKFRLIIDSTGSNNIFLVYTNPIKKITEINILDTLTQTENIALNFFYNNNNQIDSIISPDHSPQSGGVRNYDYIFDGSKYLQSKVTWHNIYFTDEYLSDTINYTYNSIPFNINIPCQIPYFTPAIGSTLFMGFNTYDSFWMYLLQLNGLNIFENNSTLKSSENLYHYTYNTDNGQVKDVMIVNDINDVVEHLLLEYY